MSLINLSLQHGRSLEEARHGLGSAVMEMRRLFGNMIQTVAWNPDRDRVRIDGAGFWVEMSVDSVNVHATGDVAFFGSLMRSPIAAGLKQIVHRTFQSQKKLP